MTSTRASILPGGQLRRRATASSTSATAPSSPARRGPTPSTRATGPVRAAARRSAPATRLTPPCAHRRPAGGRQRHRLPRGLLHPLPRDVVAASPGSTPCSATPPRWPPASRRRCGSRAARDVRVVRQAGDGGTVDIGFGCLSGMFERNDDVLFICYDNEAYMNTGVQRSGATPPAARTATTEAVGPASGQPVRPGQEHPADRHGARDPLRGDRHGGRPPRPRGQGGAGHGVHGARYLHILVPCPLGWGSAPSDTVRAGAAGHTRRACSRCSRRSTAWSPTVPDPPPAARSRTTCGAGPLRPPLRRASPVPRPDVVAQLQAMADRNIARLRPARRRPGRTAR